MEKSISVMSSSGGDIGRPTKKVRCRPEEPPNPDDPILDGKGMVVNSSGGTNESWKDKLIGNSADGEKSQKKPLISKVRIDRRIQLVEYDYLPMVCVECGWYGHCRKVKEKGKNGGGDDQHGEKIGEIKDVGKEWRHGGEANKAKRKGKGNPKGKVKGPVLSESTMRHKGSVVDKLDQAASEVKEPWMPEFRDVVLKSWSNGANIVMNLENLT
ncbi:hypothetical protein J1N35_040791 [Gossypium stocksii]|uniref:DUF4283 domain-containing protein n=1 Tax=Gossypium stocksii TaxID=47602 RepID=A0A9D3UES2_9ROSI|nr:hypothetical protein J1N35_040791 [Gossypium stocksii]